MKDRACWLFLLMGLALGIAGTMAFRSTSSPVLAGNDRHDDYILATGPITMGANFTCDGIWLLDYRAGKLLGTIVDRNLGKVLPFAEVDLVKEFNIPPKQNVHFLMTTGSPIGVNPAAVGVPGPGGKRPAVPVFAGGSTALYLTEVNSGKFAVYTMAPALDGTGRMMIRRHDATSFRPPPANPQ